VISDEIEEPTQEAQTIAPAETKPRGVPRERLGEAARRVEVGPDGIGRDLSYRLGTLVVPQQVIGYPSWPRDEQPAQPCPLRVVEPPLMKADVETSRLPSRRQREVVSICRQVANPVQGGRRPMRHDTQLGSPFPGGHVGRNLQPGRTEREVVRGRCELEAVNAMCDALDEALVAEQAVEGRTRNAGMHGLATCDDAPLVGGDDAEPTDSRRPWHYCNLPRN
jgi:hypothetical protein